MNDEVIPLEKLGKRGTVRVYTQSYVEQLKKENAELKEQIGDVIECFTSSSIGDDFEMAESAREVMEVLNMQCYRHGKVKSKLTEAKKIISNLYAICKDNHYPNTSVLMEQAEQFLKEDTNGSKE